MPKLTREDGELVLSLSGAQDFNAALNIARSISGRRFDPDRKNWCYADDPGIAERLLMSIKPQADAALLGWVRNSRAQREAALTTPLADDAQLLIPWTDKLYAFQRAAVEFMAEKRCVLLADEMGVGKTLESLSAVAEALIRDDTLDLSLPRLVVAPNSAKGVWGREIAKWLGSEEPFVLVDGNTAKARELQIVEGIESGSWVVVNYEQIRATKVVTERQVNHRDGSVSTAEDIKWTMKQPIFEETKWLAIIADEAHRAKNHKAQVSRGLWRLTAPIRFALTGTPISNHPGELWSILRWLYPDQYHEHGKRHNGQAWAYWPFYDEYVEDYDTGYGKIIVGVKNPDSLRFELRNRMIRRTKQDVLDLPEKVREYVPVKLGKKQRKLYQEAEKDFWLSVEQAVADGDTKLAQQAKEVIEGKRSIYELSNGASRTVRLRQIASTPALLGGEDDSAKLDAIVENIMDNAHKQHVVFVEFVQTANILVERLRKRKLTAEAFTGEVTATWERTAMEDAFQAGDLNVIVGTIAAMGEAVTLTAADTVHFCERSWVEVKNEQAEDRLWRAGQVNRVTVLIYEAEDTVDVQKVRPTNASKRTIVSAIIKTNEVKEVENEAVEA